MAQKIIHLDSIGQVVLQKRRGNRSIRLTIGHDGVVRVSMPSWTPYRLGEAFALSKLDWIQQQQVIKQQHVFQPDERVGKGHRIEFIHEHRAKITTRVTPTSIIIRLPFDQQPDSPDVQTYVHKAAVRALKQEAKALLPMRLKELADTYGFTYRSVGIKQLKSRWGSCSSQRDIILNCYLMQLPWDLIDYVILHELVHTRVMAHGPKFWDELGKYVNNLPEKRKAMRAHQPMLMAQG